MNSWHHSLISIAIAILPLSNSAAPVVFEPDSPSGYLKTTTDSKHHLNEQHPGQLQLSISGEQRRRLMALIENHETEKKYIRLTAQSALIRLKKMTASASYDHLSAKELSQMYGNALADLLFLDIQLAAHFRSLLTDEQFNAIQQARDKKLFDMETRL
jgi:Spy/CpxP family protein refolding chaperone